MPFATGFFGMMPLDQSIIFEAAGRMQRGDRLFIDFGISYGLIPVLLQNLLFKITGINWFSYVLHAACFNAVFAFVIYDVLRIFIAGHRHLRILATLLCAWAFYPMFGTAFLDNHSFFFGITSWWVAVRAFYSGKYHLLCWCVPLLVLGFYSKPLPAVFWVFPLGLELAVHHKTFYRYIKWVGYSIGLGLLVALMPFLFFQSVPFWYYTFELPFHIGKERIGGSMPARVIQALGEHYKIWIPTIAFSVLLMLVYRTPRDRTTQLTWLKLLVVLLVTIIAGGITANAFNNNTASVFILMFFVVYALSLKTDVPSKVYRMILYTGTALVIYYSVYISFYNFSRRVHDIYFTIDDLKNYSPVLGIWLKTENELYTVRDLERLKQIVHANKCLYIGDLFCIYSLSHQSNPWPISHIHDGTSYASRDQKYYQQLKRQLLQNLQRHHAKILIEDVTWHKREPLVADLQELKGRLTESFGNIRVFELDTLRLQQMLSTLNSPAEK